MKRSRTTLADKMSTRVYDRPRAYIGPILDPNVTKGVKPLVGVLQRIRVPRGLAVVSVVIIAFALIFAMGSLLATQSWIRKSRLRRPAASSSAAVVTLKIMRTSQTNQPIAQHS